MRRRMLLCRCIHTRRDHLVIIFFLLLLLSICLRRIISETLCIYARWVRYGLSSIFSFHYVLPKEDGPWTSGGFAMIERQNGLNDKLTSIKRKSSLLTSFSLDSDVYRGSAAWERMTKVLACFTYKLLYKPLTYTTSLLPLLFTCISLNYCLGSNLFQFDGLSLDFSAIYLLSAVMTGSGRAEPTVHLNPN